MVEQLNIHVGKKIHFNTYHNIQTIFSKVDPKYKYKSKSCKAFKRIHRKITFKDLMKTWIF